MASAQNVWTFQTPWPGRVWSQMRSVALGSRLDNDEAGWQALCMKRLVTLLMPVPQTEVRAGPVAQITFPATKGATVFKTGDNQL